MKKSEGYFKGINLGGWFSRYLAEEARLFNKREESAFIWPLSLGVAKI